MKSLPTRVVIFLSYKVPSRINFILRTKYERNSCKSIPFLKLEILQLLSWEGKKSLYRPVLHLLQLVGEYILINAKPKEIQR